jgi:hypothetical protein
VEEAKAFGEADASLPPQARLLCQREGSAGAAGRILFRCSPNTCFKIMTLLGDLAERLPVVGYWFVGDGRSAAGLVPSQAPVWQKLLELATQNVGAEEQKKLVAATHVKRRSNLASAAGRPGAARRAGRHQSELAGLAGAGLGRPLPADHEGAVGV